MIDKIQKEYRPCVGLAVLNKKGQLFAGKRLDSKTDQSWQMPQGGIDDGETPQQAALRELQEETGLLPESVDLITQTDDWLTYDLPNDLAQTIWGGKYCGQKQLWFVFRFRGTDDQINIHTDHPEFCEWAWLYPAEIRPLTVPFKFNIYDKIFELLKQHT